jgi:hypothetical protein
VQQSWRNASTHGLLVDLSSMQKSEYRLFGSDIRDDVAARV